MHSHYPFPTPRDLPDPLTKRAADGILNLLFPDSCLICATPVSRSRECSTCEKCWARILGLRIAPPWCPSCGLPYNQPCDTPCHLCGACNLALPPYSGARSYGYYAGELSRLVQGLKFQGRKNLSRLLTPLLANAFLESWRRDDIDLVVPVPLHPRRRRERGFNQAGLLGHRLAMILAIPYQENVLCRIRHTAPQVGLTDSERRKNLSGAFACRKPGLVAHRRILLIDDVMTTGTTVACASEALLKSGALRVSVLAAARTIVGME